MTLTLSTDVFPTLKDKVEPPASQTLDLSSSRFTSPRNIFLDSDSDDDADHRDKFEQDSNDGVRQPLRVVRPRLSRNIFLEEDGEDEEVDCPAAVHDGDSATDASVASVVSILKGMRSGERAPEGQILYESMPQLKDLPFAQDHDFTTSSPLAPPPSPTQPLSSATTRQPKVKFSPILTPPARDEGNEADGHQAPLYEMSWMKSFIDIFPALKANATYLATSSSAGADIPPPTPPRKSTRSDRSTIGGKQEDKRPRGPRQLFIPRYHAPPLEPLSNKGYRWPPNPYERQHSSFKEPSESSGLSNSSLQSSEAGLQDSKLGLMERTHALALRAHALALSGRRVRGDELLGRCDASS